MAPWDDALVRFAFDFARRVAGHDADAEDLAQEALLELAEAAPSHVGPRAFVGRRIVLGAKMLRRANLTRARHEQAAARQGVEGHGEEGVEAKEALALLDPEDRHAVELRFLHGLSYAEVAHVLGVTEPAARMRVHRALASLRERLGPRAESMVAALPLFLAPRSLALQTAQAAALVGGGLAMKKIVALLLLVVLAGGGVVASRAMRTPPPERAEPPREVVVQPPPEDGPPLAAETPAPEAPSSPGPGRNAVVSGRIRFEDGEPLRRAGLVLYGTAGAGETDAQGRFRLDGAQPGGRLLCLVHRKDSFVSIAWAEVKDEPLTLDVALLRGTVLEGTVVNAGSPVRNATVALDRPGARATGMIQGAHGTCITDNDGGFAFPCLPDGLYSLTVTRYGIEPGYAEVDVKAGLPPQIVTVRDARPLRIRLVSMPPSWIGKPRSFLIGSLDRRALSSRHFLAPDERGVIVVAEGPRPGRYILGDLPGGPREFAVTEAEVPEIVIDLTPFGRVAGKVSVPCAIKVGPATARTDADGRYEIDLVPPGEAPVSIVIGAATLDRPPVSVPAAGELRLDIELRGVTVRGRFVGEGHSRGVTIRRAGGIVAQSQVDSEGRFEIPFVEPGEYQAVAWTGEARGEPRAITVGHEDVDVGELLLDSGLDVPVIVSAPPGVRLAGSWELGTWQEGKSEGSMTSLALDEAGRGKVRLRPGRWRLELVIGNLPHASLEIEVPAREPIRFDLAR